MLRRLTLFVVVIACAGCIPMKEPLIDPAKAKVDKRLLGEWKSADGKGTLVIEPADKALLKTGLPSGFLKMKAGESETHYFFSTKVGEDYYATGVLDKDDGLKSQSGEHVVKLLNDKDLVKKRMFVAFRYSIKGDRLTLDHEPSDNLGERLRKDGLKLSDNGIIDSAENVRRFLTKHRKDLYKKSNVYVRVKKNKGLK